MHLVVQLHLDCEHHPDTLEPSLGNEAATAVDARDLPKSLHDESTPVGTVRLNFKTHLILTLALANQPHGTGVVASGNVGGEVQNTGAVPYIPQ